MMICVVFRLSCPVDIFSVQYGLSSSLENMPKYNTKYGIYKPNCGLDELKFAWGHDEYMYRMLSSNASCSLPQEGLDMIRYHSAYPLHDKNAYEHLLKKDGTDHESLAGSYVMALTVYATIHGYDNINNIQYKPPTDLMTNELAAYLVSSAERSSIMSSLEI